ncbi:thioesterase-like superfamily-domain-containing protein [Aspergillus ambiguus]|uniref:thioesterase family protein n=1 Tax=Aspergillus ambiguus TaxID=176160 RepID=UPI003CCDF336
MASPALEPAHTRAFEDAIEVRLQSPSTYVADLKWEWSVGSAPNGGYIAAILHRAATTHFKNAHPKAHHGCAVPIHMQLTYIRRSDVGPANLSVRDVKLGSRVSVIHITLSQDGRDKVTGYITMSDPVSETGVSTPTGWTAQPSVPRWLPPDDKSGEVDSEWRKVFLPNAEFRRASSQVEFYELKNPSVGVGFVSHWARLRPSGPTGGIGRWTPESVAFLCDIFPITLGRLEHVVHRALCGEENPKGKPPPVWFPTLGLNLDLKKPVLGDQVEWLYSHIVIKSLRNGRMDVEVVILDQGGEVVAISTQASLVMSAERNAGSKKAIQKHSSGKI